MFNSNKPDGHYQFEIKKTEIENGKENYIEKSIFEAIVKGPKIKLKSGDITIKINQKSQKITNIIDKSGSQDSRYLETIKNEITNSLGLRFP